MVQGILKETNLGRYRSYRGEGLMGVEGLCLERMRDQFEDRL